MLWALEGAQPRQLPQLPAHHLLAGALGPVLDRWRVRRGRYALRAVGGGACHRVRRRPRCGFWTPGLGRLDDIGLGRGRRPPGRALRAVRHHRARRVGPGHGRDIRQAGVDARDRSLVPRRVRRQRGDVVDLLQYRRRAGQPAHRRFDDPGGWARLAYTYLHMLLVAGIIVVAVGDELVLAHPDRPHRRQDRRRADRRAGALSGAAISCSSASAPSICRCRIWSGWGCSLLLMPAAAVLSPLALSSATTLVLVIVAVWETRSFTARRGRADAGTGSFAHSVLWRR